MEQVKTDNGLGFANTLGNLFSGAAELGKSVAGIVQSFQKPPTPKVTYQLTPPTPAPAQQQPLHLDQNTMMMLAVAGIVLLVVLKK